MDDARLSTVLHDAFDVVEAPTARLIDGALRRSRRRSRTTRLATGASAAVLVSAIVTVAVLAAGGARPTGRLPAGVSGPTSRAAIASATPINPRGGVTVPTTPQALLQIALGTLPHPGDTGVYTGRRDDETGDVFVATEFRYNDGGGTAQVDVSLETGGGGPADFCTNPLGPCTHPAPHTTLSVYQGNSRPGDSSTAKEWVVDLFRADGIHVSISEWNSPSEKDASTSREVPPFTRAQLIAWASNDAFTMRVRSHVANAARHLFTSK